MNKNFLKEALNFLESLKAPASEEAKRLFPAHPKAQEVWIKLCSSSGGIEEVVQTLGLHTEYDEHYKEFDKNVNNGLTETASLQVAGFVDFCKQQLLENFYMFK